MNKATRGDWSIALLQGHWTLEQLSENIEAMKTRPHEYVVL